MGVFVVGTVPVPIPVTRKINGLIISSGVTTLSTSVGTTSKT